MKAALVLMALLYASTSFAAADMFLQIKDEKGKTRKVPVSSDGTFECPALPAGTYTATLEWSWGATNSSSSSSMGNGRVTKTSSSPQATCISFNYEVKSPRDAASGQASGKRMHKPMTIRKEFDAATPSLAKSSPSLSLGSFTLDEDCDGLTGSIACLTKDNKSIEIESFSWGVSNSGTR